MYEERLCEVRLNANDLEHRRVSLAPTLVDAQGTHLMVNIMIVGVVARQKLQRVEGQDVTAVVVHSLESANEEEEHGLARRHAR